MEAKQERRMSLKLQNDFKNKLKSFKDIESMDDLNFGHIDLVKGETPPDIAETCLKLCQDYLSGIWIEQTLDTIEIRRVSGGLTNQLYYCGLKNKSKEEVGVPQEVAVRLYGPKYWDSCDNETNERLSDVIIGLMVSESKLGPKIYGIHETGQIQKFYKHKYFKQEQQTDPHLVKQVFQNLARIHTMDVPVKKNTEWLNKMMDRFYQEAFEKFPILQDIKENNCETLKNFDLKTEMEWSKEALKKANSPLVFAHNDYRSRNLMITEDNQLVVCDFEEGAYGYRGHDITILVSEWGRDADDFQTLAELPPDDYVLKPLIEIYIEECVRIKGKGFSENEINSVDHILKEIKIYLMNGMLFYTLFMLKNDENNKGLPFSRKIAMGFAELCFKCYFNIKKKLLNQNIL